LKVKIADFNLARILETGDLASTFCGSPLYMAPEILIDQIYSDNSDLWSVGVIMFYMLYGKLPKDGENHIQLISNVKKDVEYPTDIILTPLSRMMLEGLLQYDPKRRFSWQMCFQHEYLEESETGLLERKTKVAQDRIQLLKEQIMAEEENLVKNKAKECELTEKVEESQREQDLLNSTYLEQTRQLNALFSLVVQHNLVY